MSEALARLVELDDQGRPVRTHALELGRQVIGRADDADVRIQHRDVSRHHVAVELTPEGGVVRDLDSKNGLRVDGVEVDEAPIGHGAVLALGELELRLDHVGARIEQLLVGSGEVTVRRPPVAIAAPTAELGERSRSNPLLVPILASVVFALLLIALMVLG